jgi:hypothetical protein
MMLTSQETQTPRNGLFAVERGLDRQIAVTPLLAATAGVLRRGRHLGDRPAARIDDLLTAEALLDGGTGDPILLDVDPAVGLPDRPSTSPYSWAALHADC